MYEMQVRYLQRDNYLKLSVFRSLSLPMILQPVHDPMVLLTAVHEQRLLLRLNYIFIQNVTQLAKMGFDSPQNAKLFLQLDSIALNSSSHAGNLTLTTPAIKNITSVYNQMKSNNSTGGFTQIATMAMQALDKRSFFDGAGRNITVIPNSKDFSDILKFGTLGAQIGCGIRS